MTIWVRRRRKNQIARTIFAAFGPAVSLSIKKIFELKNKIEMISGGVKNSIMWSSYKERVEDALALRGDEGRDRLR